MTLTEAKAALRPRLVDRVLAMPPEERRAEETALVQLFPTLPGLSSARTILLYANAFPEEINTRPLLRMILDRNARLVCPRVVRRERRLDLFEIRDLATDLVPGAMGIPEPARSSPPVSPDEIDWVLVPGLGFSATGFRIGRGAGMYDRLLPTLRPDAPRWSILLSPQWVDDLPVEPHDQPLDGLADHRGPIRIARADS